MVHIHTNFKHFNENIFNQITQVEDLISITLDSNLHVEDGKIIEEFEHEFLKIMKDNNVTVEVVDMQGPGANVPIVKLTGTLENMKNVLYLWDSSGRPQEEVKNIVLKDWSGDDGDELTELLF